MDFKTNNRPKLPRNRFGWVDQGGNGGSGSGALGLDSNTLNSIYNLIDWFYKVGDVVHSRYSFAGDYEVAAYREGSSGITTYDRTWIDSSYLYILDLIDQLDLDISIDGSIDLTSYAKRDWVENNFAKRDWVQGNFPDNGSVNDNYLKKSAFDSSFNTLTNYISTLNSSVNEIEKWWWIDGSNINTSYNIIGHGNVAAYGIGDGGSIDGYPRERIDASYEYIIDMINNIDIDISGGDIDLSNYPTNSSVWKHYVHDVSLRLLDSSLQNINASIGEISTRLSNVSSKLDDLDTSVQALSSWWWLDSDGNLNTSLNVIGHQQISCYGLGEEGDINLQDYAKWSDISSNYYTKTYIDTSYNVLNTRINSSYNHVIDLIDNISINIDGDTTDLSIFVRKTEFDRHKTDVCNGITEVSTRLNDLSIFVDNMSLNVYNNSTGLKDVSADLHDWLYYESSTNTLHSRYPFVGDWAISAYGLGEEGSGIDLDGYAKWVDISTNYYEKSFIDSSYRTLDNKINNIDITGQLSNYATKSWVNSSLSKYATQTWVNTSLGNYVKKIDFNSSFDELKGDINNANTSIGEVSSRLKSTDASVLDLSTRIKNVSSNVLDVSSKLNDWLYYESSTNTLHSKYAFVGDRAISAYGLGEEGEINLDGYAKWVDISTNYYNKSYINTSYMELNNKINNIDITGQLSNYATKSWVNSSLSKYATQTWVNTSLGKYATQTWVNTSLGNYVKKIDFNSSFDELKGDINNTNTSISEVSTRLKSTDASVLDLSTRIKNVSSNVIDVSSKLNDWFYKDRYGVHCNYNFIGKYAISCYGLGEEGEINLNGYAKWVDISTNYYNKSFIDSSYRTLDNKINNIDITGQLSNYATKSWVNSSLGKYATQTWVNTSLGNYATKSWVNTSLGKYATQTWVNTSLRNYVKTTTYNTALDRISTLESDLNEISENYVIISAWQNYNQVQDTSIKLICSSIGKINTSIGTLNTSVNNVEKWFTLQNGRLVTTYPLISQQEICAYGLGESGDTVIDMTDYVSNASMNGYWIPILDSKYLQANSNVNIGNHMLNVGGNTSTGSLFVRNQANMNSKLAVKGDTTIDSSLYVAKNVSVGKQLEVTGNTYVGNILSVGRNSSTAKIILAQKDSKNQYNASIIFGNDVNYGYISGYKRITTDSSVYNIDIVAKDAINLSASNRVNVDTSIWIDNNIHFYDRGNIENAGEIYCEELIYDSDRRLKKNIRPLEYKGTLNPVEFDMVKTDNHSVGFVAQEVAEKYPQVVHENKDGYLSLDYPKITAILSAHVNYLEDKITRLEKILNEKGLI